MAQTETQINHISTLEHGQDIIRHGGELKKIHMTLPYAKPIFGKVLAVAKYGATYKVGNKMRTYMQAAGVYDTSRKIIDAEPRSNNQYWGGFYKVPEWLVDRYPEIREILETRATVEKGKHALSDAAQSPYRREFTPYIPSDGFVALRLFLGSDDSANTKALRDDPDFQRIQDIAMQDHDYKKLLDELVAPFKQPCSFDLFVEPKR